MKELLSALGGDIFRTLATLILPGAVAVTPYYLMLRVHFPGIDALCRNNTPETILVLSALSLLVGLILEDMGSWIESRVWDKREPHIDPEWREYLTYAFKAEPIGHRYMRQILMRMKFQLGLMGAILTAALGVWHLCYLAPGMLKGEAATAAVNYRWFLALILAALEFYLYRAARDAHRVLVETRHELLKGIKVVTDDGVLQAITPPTVTVTEASAVAIEALKLKGEWGPWLAFLCYASILSTLAFALVPGVPVELHALSAVCGFIVAAEVVRALVVVHRKASAPRPSDDAGA